MQAVAVGSRMMELVVLEVQVVEVMEVLLLAV
jgi:hypothetical protein